MLWKSTWVKSTVSRSKTNIGKSMIVQDFTDMRLFIRNKIKTEKNVIATAPHTNSIGKDLLINHTPTAIKSTKKERPARTRFVAFFDLVVKTGAVTKKLSIPDANKTARANPAIKTILAGTRKRLKPGRCSIIAEKGREEPSE